jgi:probable F420-dependent oxidoreductase
MTVRLGLGLFTAQLPPGSPRTFAQEHAETLELVRLAESVGFDSAWVSEHHGSSDGYLPSLLPMLAAFAARTKRIQLGTGVVLAPLHHPLRLAEDAAVVDQLSDGRLILGLGLGWREEEFRMFGVPIEEAAPRTEETIEVLRRAWTGRRFSFEGRAHAFDRVKVTPPPARPGGPPIYLGGYAGSAMRRVGRLADGYIASATPAERLSRCLDVAESSAHAAGRDPAALGLALMQNVVVSTDPDPLSAFAGPLSHRLGVYDAWGAGADTPDDDALEVPSLSREELERETTIGAPEAVADELRSILDGVTGRADVHLIVRLHYPGMDLDAAAAAVELFAAEVAPALRRA